MTAATAGTCERSDLTRRAMTGSGGWCVAADGPCCLSGSHMAPPTLRPAVPALPARNLSARPRPDAAADRSRTSGCCAHQRPRRGQLRAISRSPMRDERRCAPAACSAKRRGKPWHHVLVPMAQRSRSSCSETSLPPARTGSGSLTLTCPRRAILGHDRRSRCRGQASVQCRPRRRNAASDEEGALRRDRPFLAPLKPPSRHSALS
jgi:hypothetical protein